MKHLLSGVAVATLMFACGGAPEPSSEPGPRQAQQEESSKSSNGGSSKSPLERPCRRAFALIEANEPGEAKRREAVSIANQAYFIDDSPKATTAFSSLNGVYVFDDGSSSEAEVRTQLNAVCE